MMGLSQNLIHHDQTAIRLAALRLPEVLINSNLYHVDPLKAHCSGCSTSVLIALTTE